MEHASLLRFAAAARALADEARCRGLTVPGFRCPPRLSGCDRSLRRRPDGGALVAVRVRDRDLGAVVSDMVDGIVAVNHLRGDDAERCRLALLASVGPGT